MLEPDAPQAAQWLCAGDALTERGRGVGFDVLLWGKPARGFALRFEGRAVAYLNRCAHVPTELDWQEGEFLDHDRRFIICAVHGATYDPRSGRCVMGVCGRFGLTPIQVEERDGQVYWYPSRDIKPAFE